MPKRPESPEKPAELADLRRQITDLVARNAVTMVQNTIDAAYEGQYQALKYLFEIVGLYPHEQDENPAADSDSLAAILLRQLGIEPDIKAKDGNKSTFSNRLK